MSEVLKQFEKELESKNFKGYWQNIQGDADASRWRLSTPATGKAKISSPPWKKPAMSSASMSHSAASSNCGTQL